MNPLCVDIDECSPQYIPAVCNVNQTCVNTIGAFNCLCPDQSLAVDGVCNSTSSSSITTHATPVAVGLILSIVLPIGIVLLLASMAALVCYFWFKM